MAKKSNGIEQPTNNATPLGTPKKRGRKPKQVPDSAFVASPEPEKIRKPRAPKPIAAGVANPKQLAHVTKRAARIAELQATITNAQAQLASELDALRGELAPNAEPKARKPRKAKHQGELPGFAPEQAEESEPVF